MQDQKAPAVTEKEARILVDQLSVPPNERDIKRLNKIQECLENVKFLKSYAETADYLEVIKNLELERLENEQVLFKQGDVADKFYIILTGCIGLYINTTQNNESVFGQGVKEVARMYPGDSFGELGLLFNESRTASAICLGQTVLLSLTKKIFDKYLSNVKNEKLDIMIKFYKNLWIFRDLTQKEILKLATKTTLSKCNSNTIVIRQGEKPKGIFFISNGIIKIIQTIKYRINVQTEEILDEYRDPTPEQIRNKEYKTVDMELDEFGNGSYFCDYEVFNNTEVQYNAVAITPCDIMTLSYYDLKSCINKNILFQMQESAKFFPHAEKIKKQYFENLMWKNYKTKVLLHFNHEILNKDRQKQKRKPYLEKIDLNSFQIYDDIDQQFQMELNGQNTDKQEENNNDNNNAIQSQKKFNIYKIKNPKQNKIKERYKAEYFIKEQYRRQQLQKKQDFLMLNNKNASSKSLTLQQLQTHQQNQNQSSKVLLPKINSKSTIFNLVNQIY